MNVPALAERDLPKMRVWLVHWPPRRILCHASADGKSRLRQHGAVSKQLDFVDLFRACVRGFDRRQRFA